MLSALLFFAAVGAAAVTKDTDSACNALYSEYPEQLIWDPLGPNGAETLLNSSSYDTANIEYWNAKSSSNRAACTFFPSNAQDVSYAVGVLNKYSSVDYALKSGGHSPNLGYSSVDEGVLIAFRPNSQYAIPSADGKTVDVGAGAKWENVYTALEPLNKAAVGGRLGDIGVVGFTIGGGLSYLSAQYGLACDNVVNFEVVLANGTITNANATSNKDLFFALKGGGNQYAIVTKMTLKTYDIGVDGQIWGGVRVFTGAQHSEVYAAVANFTTNNRDPKAAIIPTFNFFGILGLDIPAAIAFFFYDGPAPANGVFDAFDAITPLTSDTKMRTYSDITNEVFAGQLQGLRFQIRENTFPNLPVSDMSSFLDDHFEFVEEAATKGTQGEPIDFRMVTVAVQPLSHLITKASEDAGGNALGLASTDIDRIWVEYDIAWANPVCDEDCPAYIKTIVDGAHDLHVDKYGSIEPTNYQGGDLDYLRYNPIFMNDAMYDQQVLESYGDATYDRLKATHSAYDPDGFFATRQKGFGFST